MTARSSQMEGDSQAGTEETDFDDQMFAAVDLDSNSFHLIVARYEHGQLQIIDRLREMVRLAAGMDDEDNIADETRDRALECLARFGERLSGIPMEHVRALATNTLRRSRNPKPFLLLAETALGHPVEMISSHEEAHLICVGVSHYTAAGNKKRLVVVIGGGTTELIVGSSERPDSIETLSAGCVTVSERFCADDKITRSTLKAAQTAGALELRPIRGTYRDAGWDEAIGSSGAVRAVAQVIQESGWATRRVTRSGLTELRRALESAGKVSRLDLTGLSEERRPVFPGGVAVLSACFRNLEIEEMEISEYALCEGALYDLIGRVRHRDPRSASVVALAIRYRIDQAQAMRVHETALAGFDQICSARDSVEHGRESLSWAARLHEVGLAIAHTDYNRHGAYLSRNATLSGFSRREQLVLSVLIQGHRRKLTMQTVAELPEDLAESVLRTCVVLRLAVLLHRSRQMPSFRRFNGVPTVTVWCWHSRAVGWVLIPQQVRT